MIPIRVPADAKVLTVGGVRRTTDETHWTYIADCPVCDQGISEEPYVLVFVGIDPEDRKDSGWTNGAAVVVHAACAGVSDEPAAESGNGDSHG